MAETITKRTWGREWLAWFQGAAVGLGVCALASGGCKGSTLGSPATVAVNVEQGAVLSAIDRYRDTRKLNAKRFPVKNSVAALCAQLSAAGDPHGGNKDPNGNSYINVFVSEAGAIAMEKDPSGKGDIRFPVGTVFVKERYSSPEQDVPDLLTVMVKKGFEYNSDYGNWQFSVVSGDGKKVLEYGRLKNCASCHAQAKTHDYVIGGYG